MGINQGRHGPMIVSVRTTVGGDGPLSSSTIERGAPALWDRAPYEVASRLGISWLGAYGSTQARGLTNCDRRKVKGNREDLLQREPEEVRQLLRPTSAAIQVVVPRKDELLSVWPV
jgi:hypothetical protein